MSARPKNAILFKGADVVSMDGNIGVCKNCDVLVQEDTIVKVEQNIEAPEAEVIDARHCINSPGFVDGHHHMWQQLLRSIATDWSLADYLVVIRRCYGSLFTAEDAYAANHVAALDLIHNVVTIVVDHCHILNSPAHTDAALKALKDSFIRGVFRYGFYENPQLPSEHSKFNVTSSEFRDAWRARKEH